MGKIRDAILGFAIGDALGVPYEFLDRGSFKCTDMIGHGSHDKPMGTWSDDTSMTLATMDAFTDAGGKIDYEKIMRYFTSWYINGEYTADGDVFDVGMTVFRAILKYESGNNAAVTCGMNRFCDNGNGSLMRILPLAFTNATEQEIRDVSSITHGHKIAQDACVLYVNIARALLNGGEKADLPSIVRKCNFARCARELRRVFELEKLGFYDISGSGYVVKSLESALYCLYHTDNYKDCVLMAVNLGSDTDTTAAIAGGLAGIVYGIGGDKGIPNGWMDKLAAKDYILDICNGFEKSIRG